MNSTALAVSTTDAHAPRTATATAGTVRWLPGPRLAWCAAAVLPVHALGDVGMLLALSLDALLACAAAYEARLLTALCPTIERRPVARLLLGVDNRVHLRLRNPSGRRLRVTVRDDSPVAFQVDQDELVLRLEPHARCDLSYAVTPDARGAHRFGDLHLRVEGLLSLGAVIVTTPAAEDVRVYPNLRGPRRYELSLRRGVLRSAGVRSVRRAGGGGEFEQLREYVPGDPFRDLDWKATAKRRRPITRVHGQERSQTVIVAIDAGRMMGTRLDALTKLDHALHAALLVSYVALRSGDRVGVIVFAESVLAFVPPRGGKHQYARILEAVYALQARPAYVDFRRLAEFVRARVPRRSLLLVLSDLLDESQGAALAEQAHVLARKYLTLCVTMGDPVAEALARAPVSSPEAAYQRAAAVDLLSERDAIKARLRKSAIGLVEAPASELAVATVNRYFEIKSRLSL